MKVLITENQLFNILIEVDLKDIILEAQEELKLSNQSKELLMDIGKTFGGGYVKWMINKIYTKNLKEEDIYKYKDFFKYFNQGIKLVSTYKTIITELFSQKLVQQLIDKFQKEKPNLSIDIIQFYIQRFQQLKNSDKVREKDINKYSWKDLETIVDLNQPKTTKNPNIKIDNTDLIYDQNNFKVYLGNSEKSCVKYGNGYSFCISARGDGNMYSSYRFDENYTIYFILDETKSKDVLLNEKFSDPNHLIVFMVRPLDNDPDQHDYLITNANNDEGEQYDSWESISIKYPRLSILKKLLYPRQPNPIESQLHNLKEKYNKELTDYNKINFYHNKNFYDIELVRLTHDYYVPIPHIDRFKFADEIIKNNVIYSYVGFNSKGRKINRQTLTHYIDPEAWKNKFNENFDDGIYTDHIISNVKFTKETPDTNYLNYLSGARDIIIQYLNEKNKLNIPKE